MTRLRETLTPLPAREGFPFNYERAQPDRNALFTLNQYFGAGPVSAVRTKWHRARLTFSDLLDDLMEYNVARPHRQHQPSYYMALESVRQDLFLGESTIIPLTTGAVAKHPDVPHAKSPGLPYKLEGFHTKGEALADPNVLKRIRQTWYDVEANKPVELPDVCCFARAQITGRDKNKVRATWGYPLDVYMAEAQWFYPYLEKLKELNNPIIAYGLEMANGGMSFVNKMSEAYPTASIFMGDWSKFDKTIPPWLIRDAFRIIEESIDKTKVKDVEGKIWKVRPWRSHRRWRKMVNYFIDTPIRMSDGRRFIKHGGVPSGSCWTNIIDSIVNAIVVRYLIYETTGSLPLADCYMGDDSIAITAHPFVLEDFATMAKREFGMILNVEKSAQTKDRMRVHFLGYYNKSGTPYKPIDSIIASTVYPERTVRTKVDTISRMVGQAYSTFDPESTKKFLQCANHLMKEENLTRDMIEQHIHEHPTQFKFLMTIGVDPRTISFPLPPEDGYTFRAMPSINRKVWKHRNRNEQLLYEQGVHTYSRWTNQVILDNGDPESGYDSLSNSSFSLI